MSGLAITDGHKAYLDFYGNCFRAGHEGQIVEQVGGDQEEVLVHRFDFQKVKKFRDFWAVFRDHRPDLYGALTTLDGG